MKTFNVLGMDPSLSNWGIAGASLDIEDLALSPIGLELLSPTVSSEKTVRQNSKDLARAQALAGRVVAAAETANLIFVEVPVGSQSSRAMASYGICVGILGVLRARGLNFIEVTPMEVKMAAVGHRRATKLEMIEWATGMYPDLDWPRETRAGKRALVMGRCEHLADALGAIHAGLRTDPFIQMRQALQALPPPTEPHT